MVIFILLTYQRTTVVDRQRGDTDLPRFWHSRKDDRSFHHPGRASATGIAQLLVLS
jgi:hypothetical protein